MSNSALQETGSLHPLNSQSAIQSDLPSNDQRLLELQGETKIKSLNLLEVDWLKSCLLILPIVVALIPMLLLKYYVALRVKCFYKKSDSQKARYIFIEGIDGSQQIQLINRGNQQITFSFKKLKYSLKNGVGVPIGFQYEELFDRLKSNQFMAQGLDESTVVWNRQWFGRNQHLVDIPNYFQYLFDTLIKPFFLLQYLICIIYILQNIWIYSIAYILFSLLTTTINYILLYISFNNIKTIAEREVDVNVIRNAEPKIVKNHDLVPGDIVIPLPNQEVCFDGFLIAGQVFANQSSLTGESQPVGKFATDEITQLKQQNRWLYEGAKILQVRPETRVVVVNVGYSTRRGRIIRKILTRVPKVPDFFMTAVYFLIETCIVGIILYLVTLPLMIGNVVTAFIVYRFLDVIAWSFPPTLPILFNIEYSFSLMRLKWKGIMGTQPQKSIEAANIRTFCFDKTGTLTKNQLQVYQIIKFVDSQQIQNITHKKQQADNQIIFKLFAACHTVRHLQDDFLGDQVDLRMFLFSKYKMTVTEDSKIRFKVQSQDGHCLQILRINQFQSKFQNMSVLAHDKHQNKYFVFVKGAPERIDKNSTLKLKQLQTLVANYSFSGYRTIAFGYKQIHQDQLKQYLEGDRQIFETKIQALGLIAFQNKLKDDAKDIIAKLNQSDIQPKMITGDNIYIAVQTGFRSGILKPTDRVLLLEGRKQLFKEQQPRIFKGVSLQKNGEKIIQKSVELAETQQFTNQMDYVLAIDNDFLMLEPSPQLTRQMKLFARISPQNKAVIVRKFKEQQKAQYEMQSKMQLWFGHGLPKVGMCGDGANDLMAIRQADVGVALSESDASYGASFTITKLLQVDEIVRESKCASQTIIDMINYFGSISFLKLIASILLVSDVTYFSSTQITYFNFAHSIWLAICIGLSSSSEITTNKRPLNNLLSFKNHIIYWVNVILPTAGFVGGYFYLTNSSSFVPNSLKLVDAKQGYLGLKCQTSTIVWLMINLPLVANAFAVYNSQPFKCSFFKNIPLLIVTLGNMIAAVIFFFAHSNFPSSFQLTTIGNSQTGVVLAIMGSALICASILTFIYSKFSRS